MSRRLQESLGALRSRGEGAFMPFLVIGDPDIQTTLDLSQGLVDAGADILEFGFPFSDPPADGPVIQAADQRALAAGTTPESCFEFLEEANRRWSKPTALLLYYNLILRMGVGRFYERAAAAGVDAILVADLPIEECSEACAAARANDIAPIFLISELTSDQRMARIAELAQGYIYVLARLGITGAKSELPTGLLPTLQRIKRHTDLPLLAGFGLSEPEHVRAVMEQGADGAICGSAIIRRIFEGLSGRPAMLDEVSNFAMDMKRATRPVGSGRTTAHAGAQQCLS